MTIIECKHVWKSYGGKHALNNLNFAIEENKITGVIGRNGAGKTTMLKILAGFYQETSGEVKVFGEKPFNSLLVSANSIMIDHDMNLPAALKLGEIIEEMNRFYVNFDQQLAFRLLEYFSLNKNQYIENLSKGMKSTFHSILGLSSRCALTIFDEPTIGMDANVRKDFYRALIKEFIAYPRTILISSHHLEEIEDLLEDVLLMKDGEVSLHVPIEQLKEWAVAVQGQTSVIADWTKDKEVIFTKELSISSSYVVVKNTLSIEEKHMLAAMGIELMSVSSSDVCVYLTSKSKGGIDDVFRASKLS